jgi:hypothetical protein
MRFLLAIHFQLPFSNLPCDNLGQKFRGGKSQGMFNHGTLLAISKAKGLNPKAPDFREEWIAAKKGMALESVQKKEFDRSLTIVRRW